MGPLKMAAMNGLSISRASVLEVPNTESGAPKDERVSSFLNQVCFLLVKNTHRRIQAANFIG